VANDVQVMFMTPPLSLPQIRAGKVRAIGYTNKTRAAYLPEVPTMAEGGVNGVEMDGGWYGMFAPAGTPPEIVNKLYAEIRKALALPAVKERLNGLGLDAVGNSPADYRKLVEQQIRDYAEMVKLAGIPPE
jgi:tripartite-type tricarboxylate transporter receptor subunit TctC